MTRLLYECALYNCTAAGCGGISDTVRFPNAKTFIHTVPGKLHFSEASTIAFVYILLTLSGSAISSFPDEQPCVYLFISKSVLSSSTRAFVGKIVVVVPYKISS
jgi:hypothetical protein